MADADEQRTPAERLIRRKADRRPEDPHELSRRSLQARRTLEGYVTASAPPRWMERLTAVDRGIERERARLEEARDALRRRHRTDAAAFAAAWRETVATWRFDPELNHLIKQHNDWYPIERRLPVDLRTRDYVLVNGRSYRRPTLNAAWALREVPA